MFLKHIGGLNVMRKYFVIDSNVEERGGSPIGPLLWGLTVVSEKCAADKHALSEA